jgi:hypothetical protein
MFIVEALMARRGLRQPVLRATFRLRPGTSQSLQLAVIPLSDAPALDVRLTLDPIPAIWAKAENPFPLQIPVIDRAVPFFMDISTWTLANERVGPDVTLYLEYRDLAGNRYEHQQLLNVGKGIEPWHVGAPPLENVARELEGLTKAIERLVLRQDRSR